MNMIPNDKQNKLILTYLYVCNLYETELKYDCQRHSNNSELSSVRQPIESFYNWLNEKTTIQRASKVRSTKGLLLHIFGKIAADFFYLIFNP
ncbi:hypothetical protein AGMMS50239_30710 [Bacteroidia bacterium]|nr:hypothetical protein AGMMS50239_30710 [Bacteroidia bacterium]